ncbi:MAG TPA: hypothetical protein VM120_21220 [Bryobacteraceae bacterium]|nr:hypothetical protein [Bryobacteraceae bacterium]
MHPSETDLALYTGGDLGRWAQWRVKSHVGRCAECLRRVEQYRSANAYLLAEADRLPHGLDWERTAAEMTANIHLGLEAGLCVTPARPVTAQLTGWRPALVLASALLIVMVAWVAHVNTPILSPAAAQLPEIIPQGVLLESTAAGIELNDHGRVLTLKHPKDREVTFSVTLDTVRARYVDSESGQVTINNVYVQ